MTRLQIVSLQISVLLTALSGIVFAWMKYAMRSDDPFSVVNHPLQPWMLAAHVVVAPLAVFALGWTFGNHIAPRFANKQSKKRRSGLSAMWTIGPMIASGYLLQVSTSDAVRKAFAVAHWISSAVFVAAFAVHSVPAIAARLRARSSTPAEARSADERRDEDRGLVFSPQPTRDR